MAPVHTISFYPVGNGDTEQIVLANERRILFDFCHRQKGENDDTPEIDLKARLNDELREAKRDYYDIVAYTHADRDHVQGSTEFFELQHAEKYQGNGRVKIRELWMPAAMLLEEAERDKQSEEFIILRQEGRHRLLEGTGIRVFSKPRALMDWLVPKLKERGLPPGARDHLFVDAGTLVAGFTLAKDGVEFFCHSPFIKHCDGEGDIIRNEAALVFNVRFVIGQVVYDFLEVGDATWENLEDIVRITRLHKNDDRLRWDLFNIPHHCSYRGLSDDKGEQETEPKPLVKHLLLQGKRDASIVSCSNPIPDDREAYKQEQPPHIQARKAYERYLREVDGRMFLVTMEEPNARRPEPIVFEVGPQGGSKRRSVTGAAAVISSTPPRAG